MGKLSAKTAGIATSAGQPVKVATKAVGRCNKRPQGHLLSNKT
jgi:hypothetical protein